MRLHKSCSNCECIRLVDVPKLLAKNFAEDRLRICMRVVDVGREALGIFVLPLMDPACRKTTESLQVHRVVHHPMELRYEVFFEASYTATLKEIVDTHLRKCGPEINPSGIACRASIKSASARKHWHS